MAEWLRWLLFMVMVIRVLSFGYHGDLLHLGSRRVQVYDDIDLLGALQDEYVDRIVLMRDTKLGAEWDNQDIFPLHIRRNVTIKSSLEDEAFASMDFRHLSGKLLLDPDVWLSIFRLRLRGMTNSPAPSFPLLVASPRAHVLFQDCLLHRTSCVPMELVYDSIKAAPPQTTSQTWSTTSTAATTTAVHPVDIELLQDYCFRTVTRGRQCFPLALHLQHYAYDAPQRAAGALGSGGFMLHAVNTTLICDHPTNEQCVKENGPEFCVTRELARRQRLEIWWQRGMQTILAVACTTVVLAASFWLLHQRPRLPPSGDVSALPSGPCTASTITSITSSKAVQWLAEVSTEMEGEAVEADAASRVRLRRQGHRMTLSAWNAATWIAAEAAQSPVLLARSLSPIPSFRGDAKLGSNSGGPGASGVGAAARVDPGAAVEATEQKLEHWGKMLRPSEVTDASDQRLPNPNHSHHTSSSSAVGRAAMETQERIMHFRQALNSSSGAGAAAAATSSGDVYDHLEVTELLGSGTFGKVFKGFWQGTLVAVKLMVFPAAISGPGQLENMAAMEAAISSSLSHPNIVQTFTWRVTPLANITSLQPAADAAAAILASRGVVLTPPPQPLQQHLPTYFPDYTNKLENAATPLSADNAAATTITTAAAATAVAATAATASDAGDVASGPLNFIPNHLTQYQPPLQPPRQPLSNPEPQPPLSSVRKAQAVLTSSQIPHPIVSTTCKSGGRCAPRSVVGESGAEAPPVVGPASICTAEHQEGFELCLILELCDAGSLREYLSVHGGFRSSIDHGSVDVGALLDVAADVGRAMAYLHSKSIVHADLKSKNVLLKTVSGDPTSLGRRCPLVAKVSDFGLSLKIDDDATHMSNMFQGTTAFMAPELLLYGRVSKASDVYSFGILMWEMYTCGEAYKKLPKALLAGKVVEGLRPDFPPETPPEYRRLAQKCWSEEPCARPSFEQIVRDLSCLRASLLGKPPPPTAQSLGSVTAQVRRNSSCSHVQLHVMPRRSPSQPQTSLLKQQQQQQQQERYLGRRQWPGHGPLLETVVSKDVRHNLECTDNREVDHATGGEGGDGVGGEKYCQTRLLLLLNPGGEPTAEPSRPGRGEGDGNGVDAHPAVVAAAEAGSSSLRAQLLGQLIDANLLVLGGCDGSSTAVWQ